MKISMLLLLGCWMLLQTKPVAAQRAELEKMLTEIQHAQEKMAAQPVAFGMQYVYSNEHTPGKLLDSLSGYMEMSGTNYCLRMDNTELLCNERYNVALFTEDKLIYVSNPDTIRAIGSPLSQMRTMLEASGVKKCNINTNGIFKTYSVEFEPGGACKVLRITIDTTSGRPLECAYVIKTASLTEAASIDGLEGYEEYALVKTTFFNYTAPKQGTARFSESRFFTREGNTLTVTEAYKDYQIFIGSPNLK